MKSRILIIAIGALASASTLSAQGLINMAQKAKSSAQSAADQAERLQWQMKGKINELAYPLHAAVQYGNLAKVQQLIADGTNLNAKDQDGKTALIWAIIYYNPEIFTSLLKAGADVNAKDNYGRTVLMFVNEAEIIPTFIKFGADVNAKDNYGKTVLEYYQNAPAEIKQLLIDAGAK